MGFTQWLLRQKGRRDPVGDLARDVGADIAGAQPPRVWPRYARRLSQYEEALEAYGACQGAMDALQCAWDEWRRAGDAKTPRRDKTEGDGDE